jgi:TadE-like protein
MLLQRRGNRGFRRGDDGAVTAEMAMALPVLVLVMWAAMWFVSLLGAQARCAEAARAAARAGARGDDPGAAARQLLPTGADVHVSRNGGWLEVDVSGSRPPPGPLAGWLPGVSVRGRSVAAIEDQLGAGNSRAPT